MSDNVTGFPRKFLGVPARYSTLESELDPRNPSTESLRAMLIERRRLIEKYTSGDGSVAEIERDIALRLDELAGHP